MMMMMMMKKKKKKKIEGSFLQDVLKEASKRREISREKKQGCRERDHGRLAYEGRLAGSRLGVQDRMIRYAFKFKKKFVENVASLLGVLQLSVLRSVLVRHTPSL